MAVAELAGGPGSGRPRDAAGRFIGATDERGGLDDRALREPESDGSGQSPTERALRASGAEERAEGDESARAPSPTATLFATTGGGDADITFSSHAKFKYILENQQAKASACAAVSRGTSSKAWALWMKLWISTAIMRPSQG